MVNATIRREYGKCCMKDKAWYMLQEEEGVINTARRREDGKCYKEVVS